MSDLPKGYTCTSCGKFNSFTAYVYAYFYGVITHTCECGARNKVLRGKLLPAAIHAKKGGAA